MQSADSQLCFRFIWSDLFLLGGIHHPQSNLQYGGWHLSHFGLCQWSDRNVGQLFWLCLVLDLYENCLKRKVPIIRIKSPRQVHTLCKCVAMLVDGTTICIKLLFIWAGYTRAENSINTLKTVAFCDDLFLSLELIIRSQIYNRGSHSSHFCLCQWSDRNVVQLLWLSLVLNWCENRIKRNVLTF